MECQQTYRGTDQNGSRQITDYSHGMIKPVSQNDVGPNVKKTNTDFGIIIFHTQLVVLFFFCFLFFVLFCFFIIIIPCQQPSFCKYIRIFYNQ